MTLVEGWGVPGRADKRLEMLAQVAPRIVDPYVPHVPHIGPQHVFLVLDWIIEVFYGGAAGGGKSDALLIAALQYVDVPGYSALILRRTFSDLTLPGAIMDRAETWLRGTPAKKSGGKTWVFPSGARLTFGYLQYHKDVEQYRSAEFQFIGFDELTQFEERSYQFMFSRLRKPAIEELAALPPSVVDGEMTLASVPLRMRSASNPGGLGHAWVRDRFVNAETKEPKAVFVPAMLSDNPSLDQEAYTESLGHLGATEKAQLLSGDWAAVPETAVFQRHWLQPITAAQIPDGCKWVRYWDLAATAPKPGKDPDYTAGALVGLKEGNWYITDMRRVRVTPLEVEKVIQSTATEDGQGIPIRMEIEGGASGKHTIETYKTRILVGYNFDGYPAGNKLERARPWAVAAESEHVKMVQAQWNKALLDECEVFDGSGRTHDDQVDAISGAVAWLSGFGRKKAKLIL